MPIFSSCLLEIVSKSLTIIILILLQYWYHNESHAYYSTVLYSRLHKNLEVGVCIHSLHKIGQHFITEDIVTLLKRNLVISVRDRVALT